MYKAIVRSQVRKGYSNVSSGNFDAVVKTFRDDGVFQMAGDHPLGGERRGREAVRGWFEEMGRLFPDLRLEALTIVVNGGPWDMKVATRFRVSSAQAGYENEGMHYLRLRWAKVLEDRLYEDTQVLAGAIERQQATAGAA